MDPITIRTGRWTNWSEGSIYGDSITLDSTSSNILIAFLGIFVGNFVASWCWTIAAYCVYTIQNRSDRDGIRAQHQLVWRNVGDPLTAFLQNCSILFSRKGKYFWTRARKGSKAYHEKLAEDGGPREYNHAFSRSLGSISVPFAIWTVFIVAGIFSQYVASPGDDVLISWDPASQSCGVWGFRSNNATLQSVAYSLSDLKVLNDTASARNYARQCYSQDVSSVSSSSCGFYTQAKLPYTSQLLDGQCPFPSNAHDFTACAAPNNNASLVMYTDMLDSSIDFG